ncbi:uncharacterized protein LOC114865370 isoform X3 [Betta splendens]|uniref:Uncharacterized protein LOC114865370 isoform X3 n=1 Tax=Betta splendens TaxID=158456 RepID=A0A6P7NXP0_BETSP|nr:uncharacterized protein LOC114865370 isoform X3 [Betta splendens]
MDRGTDEPLASSPHDSADSDDEPLIKIKTALAAKPPEGKEKKSPRSKGTNKKKDVDIDECSDNEPLIKLVRKSCKATKTPPKKSVNEKKQVVDSDASSDDKLLVKTKTSALTKKAEKKETISKSNGTHNLTTDSSDNEPLIKIARSAAAKKSSSVTPRDCIDKKKRELSADSDDSDDEPLSELAKKLKAQKQKKGPVVSSEKEILKPKRNRSRKIVKYAESSSNTSDDEPLATIKKKSTKTVQEKKTRADNKTKTKCTYRSSEVGSLEKGSDDDVPLVNLMKKMKPLKKNTKTTTVSQRSASRKRQGVSDESSDDEPLINLIKKNQMDDQTTRKTKASAPKKRETPPKKPIKIPVSGLSSNNSVGEGLIKSAKHPQVTKIIRILLERCDEDAGPTGDFNQTKTEAPAAELTNVETGSEHCASEDE